MKDSYLSGFKSRNHLRHRGHRLRQSPPEAALPAAVARQAHPDSAREATQPVAAVNPRGGLWRGGGRWQRQGPRQGVWVQQGVRGQSKGLQTLCFMPMTP